MSAAEKEKKNMVYTRMKLKVYRIAYLVIAAFLLLMPKLTVSAAATTESASEAAANVAEQVTRPINILVYILLAVIAAGGVIVLIKGLWSELIPGIQSRDITSIIQGVFIVVVGLLMIFIKLFLSMAGISI
jgi:uncharacterized protein YqhQ